MSDRATGISSLEVHVGRLLFIGVVSSAVCLGVGLVLWLAAGQSAFSTDLLAAGLIVLMATPILRVVVSVVEYARMRDWFFFVTTLIVLGVLAVTVVYALRR